jgi:hypothetical protein
MGETVGIEEWKRVDFTGPGKVRPRAADVGSDSSSREETQPMEMIAGGNDIAALVAALKEHTHAIGSLVATLAPEVPDLVGTDYIARRLGVSKQWAGVMAERGDIPRNCVAPKISGGRIWKFHKDRTDAWLREREES